VANGFYQHGLKHWGRGNFKWIFDATPTDGEDDNFKTSLIDTADYTVDLTNHEFRDATGLAAGIEETSGSMTLTDAAADGVLDASDVTFVGTAGDNCEGVLIYQSKGTAATDRLAIWWDSGSGLPVTLGGDVTVQWGNVAGTLLARI
jgi:hypothetical protein